MKKLTKKSLLFMLSFVVIFSIIIPYSSTVNAYTYPFTRSIYVQDVTNTVIYNKGYNLGNQGGIIILHFGQAEIRSGVYGAKLYNVPTFVSTSGVSSAVHTFINGYIANTAHINSIRIAIGTVNYEFSTYSPKSITEWTEHGKRWALMVGGITSGSPLIQNVEGACDIELNYGRVSYTKAWVNAFYANCTRRMYNYGDNAGTYDSATSTYSDTRSNGWTTSDVFDVSYGIPCSYPIPQIYYDSTTPGHANMPNQWWHVSKWAYDNGKYMIFSGLVSQDGGGGTLTADAAYLSFKNELAKDSRTAQSSFQYPTILW